MAIFVFLLYYLTGEYRPFDGQLVTATSDGLDPLGCVPRLLFVEFVS